MRWQLARPWRYSPLGYAAAVVWNITEIVGVRLPYAHVFFVCIVGAKGKRV